MVSALGILKWSPSQFWASTFYEYTTAMKGHLISQGASAVEPVTREEFLNLKGQEQAKTNEKPHG